jgi:hypothetical protein
MRMARCYTTRERQASIQPLCNGLRKTTIPSSDRVSASWKFQVLARGGTGSFEVRVCGPSRDATASTCRVSNTAPHHSAAQAHLCDPFPPPSQSRPTESLLFYSFLHRPASAAIVPTPSPLGQAIRISTRKGSMLADQIETHTRCRYGIYHDSNYIRCVGRYVSFVEEAMGLQISLQLLYNHHHQRQTPRSLMQVCKRNPEIPMRSI